MPKTRAELWGVLKSAATDEQRQEVWVQSSYMDSQTKCNAIATVELPHGTKPSTTTHHSFSNYTPCAPAFLTAFLLETTCSPFIWQYPLPTSYSIGFSNAAKQRGFCSTCSPGDSLHTVTTPDRPWSLSNASSAFCNSNRIA